MSTKSNPFKSVGKAGWVLSVTVMVLVAVAALWVSLSYAQGGDDPTFGIEPAEMSVYRGQTFEVVVRIEGADPIRGFDFRMTWDDSVVSVLDVEPLGPFATVSTTKNIGTNELFFGAAFIGGETAPGTGDLARIILQAPVGSEGGFTLLDLYDVAVVDENWNQVVFDEIIDGEVTAIAVEVSPAYPVQWVAVGSVFTETIKFYGANPLRGGEFWMTWDNTVVDVLDVQPAGEFVGATCTETVGADTLGFVAFLMEGTAEGTGDLAVVTLQALAPGVSPLDLFDVTLTDAEWVNDAVEEPAQGDGEVHVAESVVWVAPEESLMMVEDNFTIEVMKDTEEALGGFEFYLVWDDAKVEFVDAAPGADVAAGGNFTFTLRGPNMLWVVGAAPPLPLVPAGVASLAEITFKATDVGISTLDVIDAAEAPPEPEEPDPVILFDTDLNQLPDPQVIDGLVDASKRAVAFEFAEIADQVAGVPFPIAIRAVTEDDDTAHYFGTADLSDSTGTMTPTLASFNNGLAGLDVTITKAQTDVTITASADDPVEGTITGASNPFTVTHNVAVAVTIAPKTATVTAGDCLTYTLTAEDAYGNTWDATADATFTIDADAGGTWTDNEYCSEKAGTWTVTGEYSGLSDTATLTVEHAEAASVTIAPKTAEVNAGDCVTYTLTAEDDYGNTWDATADATFTIDAEAGGTWTDNVYCSENAGTWTVTGTWSVFSDTATLTVTGLERHTFLPIVVKEHQ